MNRREMLAAMGTISVMASVPLLAKAKEPVRWVWLGYEEDCACIIYGDKVVHSSFSYIWYKPFGITTENLKDSSIKIRRSSEWVVGEDADLAQWDNTAGWKLIRTIPENTPKGTVLIENPEAGHYYFCNERSFHGVTEMWFDYRPSMESQV